LRLLETLLEDLPEGRIRDVRMGLRWTAVVVEVAGDLRCGLCSSQVHPETVHGEPLNPHAGALERMPAGEVARFAMEPNQPSLASLGVAALNALLPEPPHSMSADVNAEQRLSQTARSSPSQAWRWPITRSSPCWRYARPRPR